MQRSYLNPLLPSPPSYLNKFQLKLLFLSIKYMVPPEINAQNGFLYALLLYLCARNNLKKI